MKNLLLILALFVVGCVSVQDPFAELSLEDVQRNEWKALKGRDLNTFRDKDDFFTLDTVNLEKMNERWSLYLLRSKVYFKIDRENYIVSLKTSHPISIGGYYDEAHNEEWFRNPSWATTANLNLKRDFCTALLGTSTKIAPKTKRKMTTNIRYFDYYESNEIDFVCYKPAEREKIVKDNKKQIAEKKLAEKIATCKTYGFKENTDGMGLCLIELDKLAAIEQQVLDIEKRNNQTYLQNQQLLKEQKRQRQAQALMNLGSAISGAGTSGAIAPPISSPSYSDSYSSTLTVNQGDACPRLNSPLVKQEVRGVNRICYYQ
ncbi:hypothetical protein OA404_01035 [SAR86 cluster bacterium]|nr:hypothetical protein [SAR86 cluster bacterium]